MPSRAPLRVEVVSSAAKDEAIKGVISLVVVVAVVSIQTFAILPAAERRVKLRKLGIARCREGRWHWRGADMAWPRARRIGGGMALAWPYGRCLCAWPVSPALPLQKLADRAELDAFGQTK